MKVSMRNIFLKERSQIGEFYKYSLPEIILIAVRTTSAVVRDIEVNYS